MMFGIYILGVILCYLFILKYIDETIEISYPAVAIVSLFWFIYVPYVLITIIKERFNG